MRNLFYFLIFSILIVIAGCEDAIDVESGFTEEELVFDAWISNDETHRTISMYYTQDYYDDSPFKPETEALVEVSNGSEVFVFNHMGGGNYSNSTPILGSVGDTIKLKATVGDKIYRAHSVIHRVPEIDSITFAEEENPANGDTEILAEFFAKDFEGVGDTYWARAYLNDTLLNKPSEIVLIYDVSFIKGSNYDGGYFIRPLRLAINAIKNDGNFRSLEPGDEVTVELNSISNHAYDYLQTVQEQATNGNNAIFTLPFSNAAGNIKDEDGKRAIGFFQVSKLNSMTVVR